MFILLFALVGGKGLYKADCTLLFCVFSTLYKCLINYLAVNSKTCHVFHIIMSYKGYISDTFIRNVKYQMLMWNMNVFFF